MPKKGTRKVIVGSRMYKYTITPPVYGATGHNGGRLTIELSKGVYHSVDLTGPITPRIVANTIKEKYGDNANT